MKATPLQAIGLFVGGCVIGLGSIVVSSLFYFDSFRPERVWPVWGIWCVALAVFSITIYRRGKQP